MERSSSSRGAVSQWHRAVVAVGKPASTANGDPLLAGSAFLVDTHDGLLCTCAHVVSEEAVSLLDAQAPKWLIGLGSPIEWRYGASLLRYSPPPAPRDVRNGLDLAILQLTHRREAHGGEWTQLTERALADDDGLIALPLGDSDSLAAGDTLVLLGYGQPSTGLSNTVTPTRGILSGRYVHKRTGGARALLRPRGGMAPTLTGAHERTGGSHPNVCTLCWAVVWLPLSCCMFAEARWIASRPPPPLPPRPYPCCRVAEDGCHAAKRAQWGACPQRDW